MPKVNLLDIIILLGAIQGFIISTLLYFKRQRIYANTLLAILLFIISLACLNLYLLTIELTRGSTFWSIFGLLVPLVIAMPIGPLIYFYVESLQSSEFRINRSQRIHFYSIIIDLMPGVIGFVFLGGIVAGWVDRSEFSSWGNVIDAWHTYADFPRWVSASVYIGFAWTRLNKFYQPEAVKWPKQFLIGFTIFQIIWLIHLIPYLIPSVSETLLSWVGWYPVYVPLAVMVYWLGFSGYLKGRPQTVGKAIDPTDAQRVLELLQRTMLVNRIYLNADLTLTEVMKVTGLSQKAISTALNQYAGKNFNDFVNEYRVKEVQRRLLEKSNEHLTITGIGYECGFNSQATFQRTFKKFTGLSPTEFLSRQSAENH